ncbi:MAG: hypothetical protein LUC93_08765, partial [Planctomycetaceae bacterium]|nr:hypothetical protein [Planctomycetaceae bacterium]
MRKLPLFDFGGMSRGIGLPFRGMRFLLARRGLKRYAVLPLIFNIILYAVALTVAQDVIWDWNVYEVYGAVWGPVGGWLAPG